MKQSVVASAVAYCRQEVSIAQRIVRESEIFPELEPLRTWLIHYYELVEQNIAKQEYYVLADGEDDQMLMAVSSQMATIQRNYRFVNVCYLPALHRWREWERVVLRFLTWLHEQHPQAKGLPTLLGDEDFAILPRLNSPIRYSIPVTYQRSLLFVPLCFHEFGHYLYRYHKDEMDALVRDFQLKLEDHLQVAVQQNDRRTEAQKELNRTIVETWYEWMQELFCDLVGLRIGGASYLLAFSNYVKISGRASFQVPEKDLAKRSHPVTWLRIKLLTGRCIGTELEAVARAIQSEWEQLAKTAGIKEEYYGYFRRDYQDDIQQTLDDMLTEADPITAAAFEAHADNCVSWCNQAWDVYQQDPSAYASWESNLLNSIERQNVIEKP